jgi:hypothetical protein
VCAILNMPGAGDAWWRENRGAYIERVRVAMDAARPQVVSYTEMFPSLFGVAPSCQGLRR